MSRVVWKFTLDLGVVNTFQLPQLATVKMAGLCPATGKPAIWVELNPNDERKDRRFVIYGTGHEIEGDDGGYPYDIHVGSLIDGKFVWHVYERRK